MVTRPAAADRAQRSGLCQLPGHGGGAWWRTAARHFPEQRGLRSEVEHLADAGADAAWPPRHRRGGDRQESLCRRGLAEARIGRGDRPVDRVHDALTEGFWTSVKALYF